MEELEWGTWAPGQTLNEGKPKKGCDTREETKGEGEGKKRTVQRRERVFWLCDSKSIGGKGRGLSREAKNKHVNFFLKIRLRWRKRKKGKILGPIRRKRKEEEISSSCRKQG